MSSSAGTPDPAGPPTGPGPETARPAASSSPGPGLGDAAAVLGLAYIVGGLVSAQARVSLDGPLGDALGLVVFGATLGLAALGWAMLRSGTLGLRALLGPRPTVAHLGIGVAVGLVAGLVINVALPPLIEAALDRFGLDPPTVQEAARRALTDPASRVVATVGVVVVAPLAEELAFRGTLFRALRRHLRATVAVAGSALLFAAVHTMGTSALGAAYLLTTLVVVGAALGVLVERHRHLWGAVLAHATFNAIAAGVIWTV